MAYSVPRTPLNQKATPPILLLAGHEGVTEVDPASSPSHSAAGFGPCPAQQAVPTLSWLLRPPRGVVLKPERQPSLQLRTPLVAVPRAPAAFPGAPGPPGPGHGAEQARGPAGRNRSWTQRRARAQLHTLDTSPGGLGEPPKPLCASINLTVIVCVWGGRTSYVSFQTSQVFSQPYHSFTCSVFIEHLLYTRHHGDHWLL